MSVTGISGSVADQGGSTLNKVELVRHSETLVMNGDLNISAQQSLCSCKTWAWMKETPSMT